VVVDLFHLVVPLGAFRALGQQLLLQSNMTCRVSVFKTTLSPPLDIHGHQ
jgi:hypothetical protein